MDKSLAITPRQIQSRSFASVYGRGEKLYEGGAISATVRRGDEISARCLGSYPEPYRVWARLADADIATVTCDCEYNQGGYCKHIVAMLLTWLRKPKQFRTRKSARDALMAREKADLLDIIEGMLARYPDLSEIIDRATVDAAGSRVDLDAIKRELDAALDFFIAEPGDRTAENKVKELASLGKRHARRGDHLQAVAIYCAMLEVTNDNGSPWKDSWRYAAAINDVINNLRKSLSQIDLERHEELRRQLVEILVGAFIWDVDHEGIGYADEATEIVLQLARLTDFPRIRERINMAEAAKKAHGYYSDWAGEVYEHFLMELDKIDATDPEETLERLRDKELHLLRAEQLLKLKRFDEAPGVIAKLQSTYRLMQGLDLLVEHQRHDTAIELAEAALERDHNSRLADWLVDLYKKLGDATAEFRWQMSRMRKDPHIKNYIGLREAAETAGSWQNIRSEIISELMRKEEYAVLIEVHLHDEDWDLAWESLMECSRRQDRPSRFAINRLTFEVAERSRHARPDRASQVYVKYARAEINRKSRTHYRRAAALLADARDMHGLMNDSAGWQALIADLRQEFARLPALQDELNKARL